MYDTAGSENHRPRLCFECILDDVGVWVCVHVCACVKGVCQAEDTVTLCVW